MQQFFTYKAANSVFKNFFSYFEKSSIFFLHSNKVIFFI